MTGWQLLAILFFARMAMAFQFQSVAALAPFLIESHGVGFGDIGLLIGLYLAPGLVAAYPGGTIGRRFGERRVVLVGMLIMALGAGLALLPGAGWQMQLAARLLAGIGGVLLNILMTKMVVDAFSGGRLATAMGIFLNSWPVGIAAALLLLPMVAASGGLAAAHWIVASVVVVGLLLFALGTKPDPSAQEPSASGPTPRLRGAPLQGALAAGTIWAAYNGALAMVFGFGAALLAENRWDAVAAGQMTSVSLWLVAVSIPIGGVLADWSGRRDLVLAAGLSAFAALFLAAPTGLPFVFLFIAFGLVGGLSAGPIMSLPADVLPPSLRAEGMGVFFTIFYLGTMGAPLVAGWLIEVTGSAASAFYFGAFLLAICAPAMLITKRLARQAPA